MKRWDAQTTRVADSAEVQDLIDLSRLAAVQDGQRRAFDDFQAVGGVLYEGGVPAVPSTVFQTAGGTPYLDSPGVALLARPECPRAWMTDDQLDESPTRLMTRPAGSAASIARPRGADGYTFLIYGIDHRVALAVAHPAGLRCRRYPAARRFVLPAEWAAIHTYRSRAERSFDTGAGNIETPLVASGGVRSWRDFVETRCQPTAEKPVQILARQVLSCMRLIEWHLFRDYSFDSNGELATKYARG